METLDFSVFGYSVFDLLVLLIIAAICGGLVQAIIGYSVGGCLLSLILGFVGAGLGFWIAVQFDLPQLFVVQLNGESYPIVWPILGAALFAIVLNLLIQRLLVDA
jgi:uncharacterized membrane protein YeaQ/YmgE (transglycosylase-associated protein family)